MLSLFFQVLKDDDNGTEASIQISGDPEKQKEAERLIKELVDDTSFPSSRYPSNTTQPAVVADEMDAGVVDWGAVIRDSVRSNLHCLREISIIFHDTERSLKTSLGKQSTNFEELLHRRP